MGHTGYLVVKGLTFVSKQLTQPSFDYRYNLVERVLSRNAVSFPGRKFFFYYLKTIFDFKTFRFILLIHLCKCVSFFISSNPCQFFHSVSFKTYYIKLKKKKTKNRKKYKVNLELFFSRRLLSL